MQDTTRGETYLSSTGTSAAKYNIYNVLLIYDSTALAARPKTGIAWETQEGPLRIGTSDEMRVSVVKASMVPPRNTSQSQWKLVSPPCLKAAANVYPALRRGGTSRKLTNS